MCCAHDHVVYTTSFNLLPLISSLGCEANVSLVCETLSPPRLRRCHPTNEDAAASGAARSRNGADRPVDRRLVLCESGSGCSGSMSREHPNRHVRRLQGVCYERRLSRLAADSASLGALRLSLLPPTIATVSSRPRLRARDTLHVGLGHNCLLRAALQRRWWCADGAAYHRYRAKPGARRPSERARLRQLDMRW